jgi:hypothetical protein
MECGTIGVPMAPGKKFFCSSPFLVFVFVFVVIIVTGSMEDDDDSNFARRLFETVLVLLQVGGKCIVVVAFVHKLGLLKPGSIVFAFRLDTSTGSDDDDDDEAPFGEDEMIVPFSEFSESTEGGVFVFLRGAR